MNIDILANKFNVDPWWRWAAVDDDGDVCVFYDKPIFAYWNGYNEGRFWDIKNQRQSWKYLGVIDDVRACLIWIGKE